MVRVCISDEFLNDLAMPAMDAVKDADGEPGILKNAASRE
jgi:hypothetical protein